MRYKPEQLPFKEFGEIVRGLKQKLDNSAPYYPLVAKAIDAHGCELMYQSFTGPFKRPEAQVTNHLKEWGPPIIIVMKDSTGTETQTILERVTVKNAAPEPNTQLGLTDLDCFNDE